MRNHRNLVVVEAADLVADEVNRLLDESPRLLFRGQLRDSAQAISANISEGLGRGKDGGRNQSFRIARGEAEETIKHLRANYRIERLPRERFFPLRNRLITISKMIVSLSRS